MKTSINLVILLFVISSAELYGQHNQEPLIEAYGSIFDVPEATVRPDSSMIYKIAIDFYSSPKDRRDINFSLDRVARAMNLHHSGGVTQEHLDVKVIAYSNGVSAFLSDEAHKKRFGKDNPNSELIERLNKVGVQMVVCGQSIRKEGFDYTELNPHVEVATSYITALTTYQQLGYVLLHF
jgi:intracellular sulfur oxidation DsrE/DsrF family protein